MPRVQNEENCPESPCPGSMARSELPVSCQEVEGAEVGSESVWGRLLGHLPVRREPGFRVTGLLSEASSGPSGFHLCVLLFEDVQCSSYFDHSTENAIVHVLANVSAFSANM